jgi:hypothetical protein
VYVAEATGLAVDPEMETAWTVSFWVTSKRVELVYTGEDDVGVLPSVV